MARVTAIGAPVLVEHPDRQQGRGRIKPGHRQKAAFGRVQDAIGIAAFKHQRAVVNVFAPDIEVQHRHGKARTVLYHLVGKTRGDALAAGLTIEVGGGHTDCADLRMFAEPVFHITPCKRRA